MTARLRRRERRGEPDDVPEWLATDRERLIAHLGPLAVDLPGETRLREVVAVAIFLKAPTPTPPPILGEGRTALVR